MTISVSGVEQYMLLAISQYGLHPLSTGRSQWMWAVLSWEQCSHVKKLTDETQVGSICM